MAAASLDREITPETARNLYVTTTLVYDPLGHPAFWANLLTDAPLAFQAALEKAG